jgi:hypothetical protein
LDSLVIGGIVFACVLGGAAFGMWLRARLPEDHLGPDSRDVIKLGMGLVGTLTALVLGLLVASAKSSFDAQANGVAQLAANVVALDRALAHFGDGARATRDALREATADLLRRTWPEEEPGAGPFAAGETTEGRYEFLYDKILELKPTTDAQRDYRDQALKIAADTARMRWLLLAQRSDSTPRLFLAVLVFWLAVLFASFGLLAPRNRTVLVSLLVAALAVSTAVFLVLELGRPLRGLIKVPSEPLRNALTLLGK